MKVSLEISTQFTEDLVRIQAREMTQEVTELVHFIEQGGQKQTSLTVKKGEEVYLIDVADIYQLYIANKVLYIKTETEEFTSQLRLYQVKDILPTDFLQISQSEIIHLKHLDHLSLTSNGLVKIVMKNKEITYSSRRYLKQIKEKLGL